MLLRKGNAGVIFISLPIAITFLLLYLVWFPAKGSIVILEEPDKMGFTLEFNAWSKKNKCELSLRKGDMLQAEIDRKGGEIALTADGKNGSSPYKGNNLESGIFTITVSETDEYIIKTTGKDATGKITVKNLEGKKKWAAKIFFSRPDNAKLTLAFE